MRKDYKSKARYNEDTPDPIKKQMDKLVGELVDTLTATLEKYKDNDYLITVDVVRHIPTNTYLGKIQFFDRKAGLYEGWLEKED